jgi:hypothetical protein
VDIRWQGDLRRLTYKQKGGIVKRSNLLRGASPLLMAAVLCAFSPALIAQGGSNGQGQQDQGQQQTQEQSKTYAGKVMKLDSGRYALVTGQTPDGHPAGHFLDNSDEAKKYEGKQVTVTGTLEVASNTIHVTKIEAA